MLVLQGRHTGPSIILSSSTSTVVFRGALASFNTLRGFVGCVGATDPRHGGFPPGIADSVFGRAYLDEHNNMITVSELDLVTRRPSGF